MLSQQQWHVNSSSPPEPSLLSAGCRQHRLDDYQRMAPVIITNAELCAAIILEQYLNGNAHFLSDFMEMPYLQSEPQFFCHFTLISSWTSPNRLADIPIACHTFGTYDE